MPRFSFRTTLLLTVLLIAGALGAAAGSGWLMLQDFARASREAGSAALRLSTAMQQLDERTLDMTRSARQYFVLRDEAVRERYLTAQTQALEALVMLDATLAPTPLTAQWREAATELAAALDAPASGDAAELPDLVALNDRLAERVRAQLDRRNADLLDTLDERRDMLARELLILTYGMHLQHTLSSQLSATLTRSDVPEVTLAVGFVDVVGWTSLSSRIDPEGLDGVLDAFEHRIIEVTAPVGEVSVVKFLGDAAMLVAPTATGLADVMLELTTEVASLEDVPLRGGMAVGPCLVREGDVFGNPVNLAARLTDLARPWRLLADADVADDLEEAGLRTQRLRPVRIRGVGTRRPLAVRRGPDADGAPEEDAEDDEAG
ncbi:MAG: adenylate/guanylate cyclase domain-containing protein [Proteobacteria bacterium]|nr:adenylate/guanylate cyclase domain-containing protein [Pseudomonadota bacterium]